MIGILTKDVYSIPHLEAFLEHPVVYRPSLPDRRVEAIAGWGAKPSSRLELSVATKHHLSCLSLENGFLGLPGSGYTGSKRLSMVVDGSGIYYDASRPSDLEYLLNSRGWENDRLLEEASAAAKAIVEHKLGPRDHAPDAPDSLFAGSSKRVLVVDRGRDDGPFAPGVSSRESLARMLRAARQENPDATLYIRSDSQIATGSGPGHSGRIPLEYEAKIISGDYSSASIVEKIDKVYTVGSRLGFEALLRGKEVRCFGMPFYAGWGLTRDESPCIRRTVHRSFEAVFAAAYMLYCRYVNPFTGRGCSIEEAIDILVTLKKQHEARRGLSVCVGFPAWKRPHVEPFLCSSVGRVKYIENHRQAVEYAQTNSGRIVVWASTEREELTDLAKARGVDVVRMEDGFLRSVGLGSDFYVPYSLVLDREGIYYDPSRPSELECILEKGTIDGRLIEQARRLKQEIIRKQVTKYNQGSTTIDGLDLPSGRPAVLVPGQVENDASILRSASDVRTNLELLKAVREARPDAFIVYKPHPDVQAGNRPGGIPEEVALRFCDKVVGNVSVGALIPLVDEVHTISSLTGFEALLRDREVFTYGGPFYAGWGLTTDRLVFPRRTRGVTLDELVAATLILYPTYYDWKTKMFCGPETVLHRLSAEAGSQPHTSRFSFKNVMRLIRMLLHPYTR